MFMIEYQQKVQEGKEKKDEEVLKISSQHKISVLKLSGLWGGGPTRVFKERSCSIDYYSTD